MENTKVNSDTQKLKLDIKKTILVGLAFFTITMFWEVYDSLMPLFLYDFGYDSTVRGIIMALDNILAIVLLPFMGLLSDKLPQKYRQKFGRRIPFIVLGSVLAAISFLLVNFAHNERMLALMLASTSFVLVFMCLYRTPAVALMPDVTPKKIRSQANTVINIMGTIGGLITLVLMSIPALLPKTQLETKSVDGKPAEISYILSGNNWALIAIICVFMVLAAVIMVFKVKENKLVEEKARILKEHGINEDEEEEEEKKAEKISTKKVLATLTKSQVISLMLLLGSVFLWYMAYNGIKTHFSWFALNVIELESFTFPLILANASAFLMFIPASILGKKIGRKFTIMIGVLLLILGFGFSSILMAFASASAIKMAMYPAFVLIGAGWATINVHSYVMSVEFATEKTTGVFTGLYYTFAMSAQILTPILAGLVMDNLSPKYLMVYALIFSCLALITMLFVKHGNAKDGTPSADAKILKVKANGNENTQTNGIPNAGEIPSDSTEQEANE